MTNVFSTQPGHKSSLLNGMLCIFIISTLLASCAKNADVPATAEQPSAPKGDKEFKRCNIVKIVTQAPPGNIITFFFEYDVKGNPVKITPTHFGTGYLVYLFRYDNKGRMTDFIGTDPWLMGFDTWHRFVYDNKNRIIRDSGYSWGKYGQEPLDDRVMVRNINYYEYDSKDRIIKATSTYPNVPGGPVSFDAHYAYDNAGNLIRPGVVYDDKISIYRTNSIWMFLERDYSVNNSWPIEEYNKYGLPTLVSTTSFNAFMHFVPFIRNIEYDCKGNQEN